MCGSKKYLIMMLTKGYIKLTKYYHLNETLDATGDV